MTMKEAMYRRHMVRKYQDKSIPDDLNEKLSSRINENNERYGLGIRLITNDGNAVSTAIKLILTKNVKNYFVMAGPESDDLDEKLGYCGADLMLYAQTLGLNTWWIGGTFNRKAASAAAEGNKAVGVIAVGYGETQGKPHKTKTLYEVSSYNGEMPAWFTDVR